MHLSTSCVSLYAHTTKPGEDNVLMPRSSRGCICNLSPANAAASPASNPHQIHVTYAASHHGLIQNVFLEMTTTSTLLVCRAGYLRLIFFLTSEPPAYWRAPAITHRPLDPPESTKHPLHKSKCEHGAHREGAERPGQIARSSPPIAQCQTCVSATLLDPPTTNEQQPWLNVGLTRPHR